MRICLFLGLFKPFRNDLGTTKNGVLGQPFTAWEDIIASRVSKNCDSTARDNLRSIEIEENVKTGCQLVCFNQNRRKCQ